MVDQRAAEMTVFDKHAPQFIEQLLISGPVLVAASGPGASRYPLCHLTVRWFVARQEVSSAKRAETGPIGRCGVHSAVAQHAGGKSAMLSQQASKVLDQIIVGWPGCAAGMLPLRGVKGHR